MLNPEVSAVKKAVAGQATVIKAVCAYMDSILRIPVDPEPVEMDGFRGEIDPLSDFPSLKDSLSLAQSHVLDFEAKVVNPLHVWAIRTVPDFSETFQARSSEILSILNDLGSGTPTPAAREAVMSSLTALSTAMAEGHAQVVGVQQALANFLTAFSEDHLTLTVGENSLQSMIDVVRSALPGWALRYGSLGLGAACIGFITDTGYETLEAMQETANLIGTAADNADQMDDAFSALETVVETPSEKYSGALREVDEAKDEDFGSVLQRLEISTAQVSWKQLAGYLSRAGL